LLWCALTGEVNVINDIKKDTEQRMTKSIDSLKSALAKIRTGRAHPSILENIQVNYYGSDMPLMQVAAINVEDARTLVVVPWEAKMVPEVEKAIMKSDLGLNPSTAGTVIRVPMAALTEETRRGFIKQAKGEAEHAKVSIRNIRRDANTQLKDLLKEKTVSEDQERRAQDDVQKLTDRFVADVEKLLASKETDLMAI
jgi:ribosome recycling factor